MIHDLLSSDVAWRLGWALLHSLWQILLIGALTGITLALFARRSANERYVIACGGMAAMYVPLVVTFLIVPPHPVAGNLAASGVLAETFSPPQETRRTGIVEKSAFTSPQTPNTPLPDNSARSSAAKSFASQLSQAVSPWLPSIVGTWLTGITLLAIWHAAGWVFVQRLRNRAVVPAAEHAQQRLAHFTALLQIDRPVRLVKSLVVEIPTVIGWFRPVILLPANLVISLTPAELDAILAHELAHVRRHDYLVNLLQSLTEIVLFYHPAVWMISRRIRIEREFCCDDAAIAACGDGTEYARALAAIEQGRVVPAPAVAFLGRSTNMTFHRIQRILSRPPYTRHAWFAGGSALLVPLLMLVLVGTLLIQTGFVATLDDSSRRASSDGDSDKIQSQLAVVDDRGSGEPSPIESGGDEQVDVSQFRLILTYHGDADKPFYNLTLSVPPLAVEEGSPTNRFVPIDEEQAAPIANWLSASGYFKHARITQTQNDPPGVGPQYLLRVRIRNRHYEESLGWNLGTLTRLDWLRKTLDGEAAKSMDLLLRRLAGQRKVWESGEVVNGLKTTISAEANTFGSGRPIPIKVYIENVGNADRQYTQVRLNGSDFAVTDNHGRRAPLLGGYVGRPARETTIKPGESKLIGTFDLSTGYYLRRPGRYSVSFVGYGMPPSNSFSFSVAPDAAGDADGDPVRRLLPLLSSQWTLVGSPNAMQKRRPGNNGSVAPASLFMFVDPAKGIKGSEAIVRLWLTDKAAENNTPPANAAFTVNESLGTVAQWNAYVQVSQEALKLWPSVKEDLKNALNDEAASTGVGPDQSAVSDDDYRTLHDRYKAMILTAAKAGKKDEVARLTDQFDASIGGKLLFIQVTLRVGPIAEHEPLFGRIFDKSRKISIGKLHFAVSTKPIVSQNHDGQGCVLIATNPLAGNKWPDNLQVTLVMDSVAKEDIGTTQTLDGGKLDVDNRTNGAADATVAAAVLSQVQSPDVKVGIQRIAPGMRENKIWLDLRNRLETSGMMYRWVEVSEKGECRLNLSTTPTSDLAPLKGMPLVYLDASHTPVSDLSPLEGMPLRALNLSSSQVQSLAPLKGMKLTTLIISGTRVNDLSPVADAKLSEFVATNTAITDLSPLTKMPLAFVDIRNTAVKDLGPLANTTVSTLQIEGCQVKDLRPLRKTPLRALTLAGFAGLDLSQLQGIRLTTMALSGKTIEDLAPLRGIKFESLRVIDSGVKDISALAGMPLTDLDLRGSPVSDLAPLKGMKLVSLYLSEPVADLAPLGGMPLETISVPAGTSVKSMNVLREIKTLKWIRFARTGKPVPVADFWRMYGK